jgi:hypothetical protein
MKTFPSLRSVPAGVILTFAVALVALAGNSPAQGLPQAARDNIHKLFDNHSAVKRTVTLTETGYLALTESDDPQMAKTLRSHVAQMQERIESGLAVRRWDPAYEEMARHYKDLSLQVEPTEKGLRVVMTGKTPEAVMVAQNHAQIVSQFVARGWDEHDVRHAAVAGDGPTPARAEPVPAGGGCGKGGCCANGCKGAKTSPATDSK